MSRLMEWLFGCTHRSVTWPRTQSGRTYIVCTDCGQEFDYSLRSMKVTGKREIAPLNPAPEVVEAELERMFRL